MLPLFLLTVFLPLIVIATLWRRARRPTSAWVATLFLATGVVGFSVLVAPWGIFGLPLRYVMAALFLAAVVRSWRREPEPDARQESPLRALVKIMLGLAVGGVAFGVLRGHAVPPGAIDLAFPLRDGAYLIGHGGSTSASNMHHSHPQQKYALDIVKLNRAGMRARAISPADLRSYAIYGATIGSPCNGTVLVAVDGLPDTRDEKRLAGNHVILRCGDADVWLAHMQRGSVAVRPGMQVRSGQPLGRVGNSGNTTEPHLHVHAERNGAGVPATFDGDWLVRNDLVRR
ncbi:MAG TPA: M23 family metallopeptidase [Thermoanaerobaculia bacterium]